MFFEMKLKLHSWEEPTAQIYNFVLFFACNNLNWVRLDFFQFIKTTVMRRSLACIVLVCSCLLFHEGFAQLISVGVKGGISIPNLRSGGSNPVSSGYQSGLGPNAAVFGEYSFSNLFSVELGLEYSAQGGRKHGKQALTVTPNIAALFYPYPAPPYLWTNFDADANLNYLMIPLLGKVGFDVGNHAAFRVFASAGPFAGFLLSAKTVTKG